MKTCIVGIGQRKNIQSTEDSSWIGLWTFDICAPCRTSKSRHRESHLEDLRNLTLRNSGTGASATGSTTALFSLSIDSSRVFRSELIANYESSLWHHELSPKSFCPSSMSIGFRSSGRSRWFDLIFLSWKIFSSSLFSLRKFPHFDLILISLFKAECKPEDKTGLGIGFGLISWSSLSAGRSAVFTVSGTFRSPL